MDFIKKNFVDFQNFQNPNFVPHKILARLVQLLDVYWIHTNRQAKYMNRIFQLKTMNIVKKKIVADFINKFSQNLMQIEFCWRKYFEILIFYKPSVGTYEIPQNIWARSV